MQQTPNFNRKQLISKEELKVWDNSLRELLGNIVRYGRGPGQVGGILDGYDPYTQTFVNDFFKVSVGSTPVGIYNTIKITTGRGVLNVDGLTSNSVVAGLVDESEALLNQLVTLFRWEEADNIPVDDISGYNSGDVVYVGFIPEKNPLEPGVCTLTISNQVTIAGGDFNKLRGQSTKSPIKVRFYKTDGSPAQYNYDTYEVISITSSTQMIVSGVLSAETNLKMMIVGSYDLSAQGSLTDKFSYSTIGGKLTFSKTATDITDTGFIIASLTMTTVGSFSITDMRTDNLFNFWYSSQGLQLKASLGIDNTYSGITADFILGTGASLYSFGDVVYLTSTGTILRASNISANLVMGMIVSVYPNGNAGSTARVLLKGFIRKTTAWFTAANKTIYLGETGAITETIPAIQGRMVQILGLSSDTNKMYFNPQLSSTIVYASLIDHSYHGTVIPFVNNNANNTNLNFGDIVYIYSENAVRLALASVIMAFANPNPVPAIGIVVSETAIWGEMVDVMIQGEIRNDSFPITTIGKMLYLGEGTFTETRPPNAPATVWIQHLGVVKSVAGRSKRVVFNPSLSVIYPL